MHRTPDHATLAALLGLGLALTLGAGAGCREAPPTEAAAANASTAPTPPTAPATEPNDAKGPALADLFAGSKPTMPPVYGELRLGMTGAEAKKIVPTLPEEETIRVPAYPDTWFNTSFDRDSGKLTRVYFGLPSATAEQIVTAAWGEPVRASEYDKPVLAWFNPEAGLRATLKEGFGEDMDLELTAYVPAAHFVGADGPGFGFEAPRPLLGATIADLRQAYPGVLVEKSSGQAREDRAELERLILEGEDGDEGQLADQLAILGPPRPSAHLDFPPTEFEAFWTRVNLSFDDAGRVSLFRFGLPFGAYPPAKAELLGLLEHRFGAGREEERYGKKIRIFREDPRVEVEEDTITHQWDVTVEPKGE